MPLLPPPPLAATANATNMTVVQYDIHKTRQLGTNATNMTVACRGTLREGERGIERDKSLIMEMFSPLKIRRVEAGK